MAASKRSKKGIEASPVPHKGGRIRDDGPPPEPDEIRFSFKHLHPTPPVSQIVGDGYYEALFERLKAVSQMKRTEFLANRNDALKAHGINWEASAVPNGFNHIRDPQLRDYKGYQFSIDRYNHGRVVGLLVGNTFHICWLDPNHETCP